MMTVTGRTANKAGSAPVFSHISVKPLHPTFAAEISGVDFKSSLSDEVFQEIYQAITKVYILCVQLIENGWID